MRLQHHPAVARWFFSQYKPGRNFELGEKNGLFIIVRFLLFARCSLTETSVWPLAVYQQADPTPN